MASATVAAVLMFAAYADPVPAALAAAARPPAIYTADPATLGGWCVAHAGEAPPKVSLPAMRIEGARMDSISSANAVTLYYTGAAGEQMAVTWVEMTTAQPGTVQIDAHSITGGTALVVHDNADIAVISGNAQPAELWRVAASVAAAL